MGPPESPITMESVDQLYEWMFAPWVKRQRHEILTVEPGFVVMRLPQDPEQQFFSGAMCGQSLMSAIDTAMSIAMMSVESPPTRGTASQNTQFLRPASGEDLLVEARVLKAGRTVWYGESHVRLESSGDLVAHATCEFL